MNAFELNAKLIREIKPSMSYDGKNLEEWQRTAKAKLAELLGMDKFTKVAPELDIEYEKKIDGATEIRFTFQSEDGYRVPCHLLLPDGVENPPVMICLQGHSTGMHISLGRAKTGEGYERDQWRIDNRDSAFCVRAVKEGFAAIALEQRNFGECGYETAPWPECHKESLTAFLLGRTTIGGRIWDVSRLIDVLETDFFDKIDLSKICLMGNSGGGTATAYAAAIEDRLALAMPSCAMCSFKDSIGWFKHCDCNYVPGMAPYFTMGDVMAMACPKFFVQVSGVEDPTFLIDGAVEVYEEGRRAYTDSGNGDRCALVKGDIPENGGHRFYADDAWPIVHKMMAR